IFFRRINFTDLVETINIFGRKIEKIMTLEGAVNFKFTEANIDLSDHIFGVNGNFEGRIKSLLGFSKKALICCSFGKFDEVADSFFAGILKIEINTALYLITFDIENTHGLECLI